MPQGASKTGLDDLQERRNIGGAMIVVPYEDPVFEQLNTYYLDISKVLEHFRGSIGSGAVRLRSQESEGVIFFDADDVLNAIFKSHNGEFSGQEAVQEIFNQAQQRNYSLDIYHIDQDNILYWANIFLASPIYKDLSSEFTDLQGLIKKQQEENLTGYILADINQDQALLFFNSGQLIGAAYSWTSDELNRTPQKLDEIHERIHKNGALLHVYQIAPEKHTFVESDEVHSTEETIEADDIYTMFEDLLDKTRSVVTNSRSVKEDFSTLLRKKFLEKANIYPFLDPFAAELEYKDGKIYNYSDVDKSQVVKAVLESIKEIINENNLEKKMNKELEAWRNNYSHYLSDLNIHF